MLTKKKSSKKVAKQPEKENRLITSNSDNLKIQNLLKSPLNVKQANGASSKKDRSKKTEIKVCFDAGFSNELYIRGAGAGLSWEKGQKLKNISKDQWVWQCDKSFSNCEFKILINDEHYEEGANHQVCEGESIDCHPKFC